MKIAITGATGFIGRLLIERHLKIGDEVHVLTRNGQKTTTMDSAVIIHMGNLKDRNSLLPFLEHTDILYHCAAELLMEDKMYETNVEGTKNLIEASHNNVKHWVQLSSVGVYGPVFEGLVEESHNYNPNNQYERTKLEADKLVLQELNAKGITFSVIRPSNVFGVSMKNASVFELIRTVDKGYFFYFGKKGASANYVAVENVVEALYLGGTHPLAKNEIFIVSDWTPLETFISYIAEALKKKAPRIRVSKKLMILGAKITSFMPKSPLTEARINALSNFTRYSTNKIESRLGYAPVISTKVAIKNLVAYYIKNKE